MMNFSRYFIDRHDAGKQLARYLAGYTGREDTIVLALPRGGVPVAYEVAKSLNIPMDIYIVRKLGAPGYEEYAMGAIAMDGTIVLNEGVSEEDLQEVIKAEKLELERRHKTYCGDRPQPVLSGKTVIIIDDGIATGATMSAAIAAIRKSNPKAIIVAVPVCAPSSCAALEVIADEVVSVVNPATLSSVGEYYQNFDQTTDAEVKALMGQVVL